MKIKLPYNHPIYHEIEKVCMTPDDFMSEYLHGAASSEEKIRRIKEYIRCVKRVEREYRNQTP